MIRHETLMKLNEKGWSISIQDDEKKPVAYPTLSELIEACGDEFGSLSFVNGKYWSVTGGPRGICINTEGKTTEEAVARLWLELNKK
jgi:hypothetical protein